MTTTISYTENVEEITIAYTESGDVNIIKFNEQARGPVGATGATGADGAPGGLREVKSASFTASNDTAYTAVASLTTTDPSPVEGKGFSLFVRNGTATIGGVAYATAGTIIERVYHSGAWSNSVYQVVTIATDSALGLIKSSTDILVDASTGVATVSATDESSVGTIVRRSETGTVAFESIILGGSSGNPGVLSFDGAFDVVEWLMPAESGRVALTSDVDAAVVGLLDDRGNYDASGNTFPASGGSGTAGAVLKGDLWTVSVAGTLGGSAVTAGDVIRALTDTPGQTAGNWVITENNLGYVPQNTAATLALGGFSSITGTIADANISSAATWNAKQSAITFGTNVQTAIGVTLNAAGGLVTADGTATLTNKSIDAGQLTGNVAVARIATALTAPGAIGGTTPSTGAFTILTITGLTSSGGGPSSFNATVRASGSLGAPNFAGTSDTNTGVHMPGSDILNLVTNALARWTVNASGDLSADATNGGGLTLLKTITAVATTGAQTINKTSGRVNFAAAATSLVVTNSLCTANSIIHCTIATNDATANGVRVVAAAGSFTIHMLTAPTAETAVNFLLTN